MILLSRYRLVEEYSFHQVVDFKIKEVCSLDMMRCTFDSQRVIMTVPVRHQITIWNDKYFCTVNRAIHYKFLNI